MTPAQTRARERPRLAGALLRTQPDERLAELAGEGSKPAFDEIVRRHRSALVAFAARMAPPDRADDVVQESMVKAYLALGRGDRPEIPKAWLFKIVRNTALNDQRDWRIHEHLDENYDGVEQPPEAAEKRRQLKQLVVALRDLPEAQREAIVQRELEGKGHDEIASALKVSPGAVRQLIFRARGTLRAGIGALIPIQVLRWVAMAGADPATIGAGAAGTGIGLSAAKVGLGAVLATGAVVAGTQVSERVQKHNDGSNAVAAEASAAPQSKAAGGPAAHGKANSVARRRQAKAEARQAAAKRGQAAAAHQAPPPPPRPLSPHRPPPPGGGHRVGGQKRTGAQQPPPPGGSGTSGSGTQPPSGSGQQLPPQP